MFDCYFSAAHKIAKSRSADPKKFRSLRKFHLNRPFFGLSFRSAACAGSFSVTTHLLFPMGDGSAVGEGRAVLGCRNTFRVEGGVGWRIVGYVKVLAGGAGLIVTSVFGIGVD